MSIAAETIMAHLSTCIFLSPARLKAEQRSVGKSSPPKSIKDADDYVRRVRGQIKMIQYARGRTGEDRSTALDVGRVPGHGAGGQKRVLNPHLPEFSPVTSDDDEPPVSKRPKRPESDTTVIDSGSFS
jgi:hypothetical protein